MIFSISFIRLTLNHGRRVLADHVSLQVLQSTLNYDAEFCRL